MLKRIIGEVASWQAISLGVLAGVLTLVATILGVSHIFSIDPGWFVPVSLFFLIATVSAITAFVIIDELEVATAFLCAYLVVIVADQFLQFLDISLTVTVGAFITITGAAIAALFSCILALIVKLSIAGMLN